MHELAALHHVALSVSDCEASAAWYARVLDFVPLFGEDAPARRARIMGFPGGGYSVGLVEQRAEDGDERKEGRVRTFDPRHIGLDHMAFGVAHRSDLDDWAERLTGLGVGHSGVIDIPVGAILNFVDPDGIALALSWDGPTRK